MPRRIPWGPRGLLCALSLVAATASTTARAAPNRPPESLELQLRQGQARFEGKWLRVRVGWHGLAPAGALEVRLLDLAGRSLATASHPVAAKGRGPAQLRLAVPARHRRRPDLLRLSATFRPRGADRSGPRNVVALSEIGDMPFLWLRGQTRLTAGSRAALRVTVRDLQSRPLPGAKVTLTITAKGRTLTTRGITDDQGGLQLTFGVDPTWAGQTARLKVTARTAVFSRTLRERIQIRRAVQSLLTTDKPIYQPGQTVHVRLLVLRQPSRKPLARASVVMSALDNRGNRLIRKTTRTDEFGVAWTRVVLSKHAAVGPLTLQARVRADARHTHTTQVKVRVFRYRVPSFRLKIMTDRGHYRPGGRLRATVEARYLQGKPVPTARVRVEIRLLGKASTCGSRRTYCRHYEMSPRLLATVKGSTDRRGRLRVRALIPRTLSSRIMLLGGIRIQLRATVTEPGGHRRTIARTLPVSHQGVLLAAVPEAETLVPGVVQRVFVIAAHPDGTPAPGRVQVDYWERGAKGKPSILRRARVRTDDAGVAAISVNAGEGTLKLRLSAVDRRGLTGYREVVLNVGASRVLVQPQRTVWKGGEPLRVTVRTAGLIGRVYLDIKHRDQTVQTATTTLVHGQATMTVKIPPSLDGLVTVVARVGGPGLRWHRGWAPVLVQSARRLHLRIRAHRKRYRPGDKARLQVRVTDEQGRGQRVALGLTVVDQGVYVLAGKRPGGQHNRFLLERAVRTTKTSLAGWTPERLLHTPRSAKRRWLAAAMLARLRAGGFTVASDNLVRRGSAHFKQYRRQIKARVSRQLTRWFKGRFRTLLSAQRRHWIHHHRLHPLCPRERASIQSAEQLVTSGRLSAAVLSDPWGTPLTWTEYEREGGPDHLYVELQSAGPDASWSTVDDLKAGPYKLLIPRLRRKKCRSGVGGRGFGVGSYRSRSPRVFSSRASVSGGLGLAAGELPTFSGDRPKGRVRRNFRETLVTLPGLRTDAQGRATVNLHLADNITTWVVSSIASGLMGRLGGAVARVRAFQPFYVDTLLPQQLTRTDEVEVPVVVHNYSNRAATVRLRLQGSAWLGAVRRPTMNLRLEPGPKGPRLLRTLATSTGTERIVIVPPQSVASTRFRIRALRVGRGSVIVHAQTAGATDSVERTTRILPEGHAQARGASGFLSGTVVHRVTLPSGFVPDSQRLLVTLEPNVLAASLSSLDSLLRKPHGCMEQSSAVTYPNILALRHLRRIRTTDPKRRQVIAKAKRLVNAGYQRLLGFEVAGGGFSLYGSSPADVSLSALGLAQLTDLATVRYVDPRVIARTRRHLLRRQSPSGSWKPEGYVDLGGGDPLTRRYVVTAYVTWLLARSSNRLRPVARAIHRALGFLRTHLYLVRNNPYALALAANAAGTPGLRSHHPFARRLQNLLMKLARPGRITHWRPSPGHRTIFAGNGQAAAQETTALALMALRPVPTATSLVAGGMRFLLKERKPAGAWSTTRATVLALLALLRLKPHPLAGPRKVRVYVNGQLRGELRPTPTGATTQSLDLSAGLSAATHLIRLVPVGGRGGLYRIGLRYHSRHRTPQVRSRPRIRVRYSRLRLRPRRSVQVSVRLENPTQTVLLAPMVEIGLPPGFELHNPGLQGFASRAGVKRTEKRPGKLLLYFSSLPKGATTFSFRLRARFPLRVQIPSSRFYEYYQPEHPSITDPAVIVVERPKLRLASLRDLLR